MFVQAQIEEMMRQAGIVFERLVALPLDRSTPEEDLFIILIFIDDGREPFAILKTSSSMEKGLALNREFENLKRLADAGITSVPKPIYFGKQHDQVVLLETAVGGRRMKNFNPDRYFTSPGFTRHFEATVEWLVSFHEGLGSRDPVNEDAMKGSVERYRSRFEVSSALNALLEESVNRLKTGPEQRAPVHGDFSTANTLVNDGDEVFVIDWENSIEPSWPLKDLVYFISSLWCVPYQKGTEAYKKNFQRLWFDSNVLSELIRTQLSHYLNRLALDAQWIVPLSTMVWLEYANEKMDYWEKYSDAEGSLPLTIIEDRKCLNLEWLAERRVSYENIFRL